MGGMVKLRFSHPLVNMYTRTRYQGLANVVCFMSYGRYHVLSAARDPSCSETVVLHHCCGLVVSSVLVLIVLYTHIVGM